MVGYEFTNQQNARFSALAAAMAFVGIAQVIACAVVIGAVAWVGSSSPRVAVIVAIPALVLAVTAVHRLRAAAHFRRIAATRGNDIDNLMTAVDREVSAYRLQRWLWLAAAATILVALATTIVGY
jgi:hypothetical protein